MYQKSKVPGPFGLAVIVAVVLSACGGGGGGGAGFVGSSGNVPTGTASVVAKISAPAPLAQCPTGGITVDTGIDTNQNGLLDPGEVDLTQYVCDGARALVSIVSEPSGTNCPKGGSLVSSGSDTNGNGILDPGEVTSTDYICNGANGSNGGNGAASLLSITTEPVGGNCATGGLKVVSWLDSTANGTLDLGETSFTNYLCNTPGTVVIQSISANPAVVRPGADTSLKVSATDGVGSPLTYQWSGSGSFSLATSATTTWTAPSSVGSYLLSVVVSNGSSTVTGYASILVSAAPAGPVVTSVSPQAARAGDEVLITGAGFGATRGTSAVSIGGVAASTITYWSEYQIKAIVPSGAVTGSVVVTVGGVAGSPGYITVPWSTGISTAAGTQSGGQIVSDGEGGAIIVWEDNRGADTDIYAQRVNSVGAALWTTDGVPICTSSASQSFPQLVSDGAGGAIIVWQDDRAGSTNTDIYAQRVNSAGLVVWTVNGVPISTAAGRQAYPQLASDGSGGAIIVWEGMANVWVQRVNGSGAVKWTADGIALGSGLGDSMKPQVATDGAGGAIITWDYFQSNIYDIYAQRVSSPGTQLWTAGGVAITADPGAQLWPQLVSDGVGGAIIAWTDGRGGTYAQRVNTAGTALWTANGAAISTGSNQADQRIVSDGDGGAIISWTDDRNILDSDKDVYAQRVNSAGTVQWGNGVPVCTAISDQMSPQLVPDGSGGAIVTWFENRTRSSWDVYAQRMNSAGAMQWTANGIWIYSTAASHERYPQIASDGAGGAIIVWEDSYNGNTDIYGQSIGFDGTL